MYNVEEICAVPARREALARSLETLDPPELRCLKIKLTSRCNLRCRMCKYWQTESETALDRERWLSVLEQAAALGCRKVHFSGGEVFLRPDFLDLVERTTALGMKANLTTNGTLLTRQAVHRLVRARPNSLSLSLDGPRAGIHDRVRGVPGSFRRTCRTIRRVLECGERLGRPPRVRINFVVMRHNFRSLPDMVRLAADLGATELHPMPVDEKGERRNRLSRSQIRAYNRDVAPEVLALRQAFGFSTRPDLVSPFGVTEEDLRHSRDGLYARGFYRSHPCFAPWLHLFVAWDGECYLCCMTNGRMESLGNVGRQSLAEVFRGERMRSVRAEFRRGARPEVCARCDMFLPENGLLQQALAAQSAMR